MSWRSFICASRGIVSAARRGKNICVMFICIALVVAAGFVFGLSGTEWAIVLLCCGSVVAFEIINTAIECVVDMVSPDYHDLAKKAKDVAAGAVLITSVVAAVIGLVIFVPHIAALITASSGGV